MLKLTESGKTPGQDNINSELYKYAPEEFKLRLLHFLNNMYRESSIPDKWRNAVISPIFKKDDRRNPKTAKELVFLAPAIRYTLNFLIRNFRSISDRNTKWIPKGVVMHGPNIMP